MNISHSSPVRVGELQRTLGASSQIAKTQAALAESTRQITTGKRITRPSDSPADAASAQQIRRSLELQEGYRTNLNHADRQLSRTDQALSDATDLLREARQIGLANAGDQATQAERDGAATVLRTIESQLLAVANTNEGGISLFGGGTRNPEPFRATGGGIVFSGGDQPIQSVVGRFGQTVETGVAAADVFGGNSRRVGTLDLDPGVLGSTRLGELDGARGSGVERGSIRITNAGSSAVVDLSDADTITDVINRINATGIGVVASLTGDALQVSGASVTVGEVGGGTAADLGILSASPVVTVAGDSLQARLTSFTPLASLNGGAGVSAGTFDISNGSRSATINTAGLATVGDLVNAVNATDAGVSATISVDGTRVLLRNSTQGSDLRITDSGGGTTAQELGWLTFTDADPLTDFNNGLGVRLDPDGPDLSLTDVGGTTFEVDLDGTTDAASVVTAINTAAASAGATTTASFDPTLPGLRLINVQGIGTLGTSQAVGDLGLDEPIAGNTIEGRDVNAVGVDGPFTHLKTLIRSLETGNLGQATTALSRLELSEDQVITVRGEVGGQLREVEQRRDRLEDTELTQRELLSRLEDVDLSTAILEYETLQTSLQAQLQTTSNLLNLTLFDFLR
ncbi:MAG: hypothetical protein AAGI46_11250 [Planctomycetota bacterium]